MTKLEPLNTDRPLWIGCCLLFPPAYLLTVMGLDCWITGGWRNAPQHKAWIGSGWVASYLISFTLPLIQIARTSRSCFAFLIEIIGFVMCWVVMQYAALWAIALIGLTFIGLQQQQ